ncbi:MAG: class I tRNA ligase family protein, partial [Candidatus Electryonea clarkiae]|nr:class I tRNA ligase family protein [Candidatus Electryonea clarkiae]
KIRLTEDAKGGKTGERILIAKDRLPTIEGFIGKYEIEATLSGSELAGMRYNPLWDFQKLEEGQNNHGHFVIADEYVTADDGTGMVHIAPYGEDDHRIIKQHKLTIDLNVNSHGYVEKRVGDWAGRWFKDDELEIDILRDLAARNLLLAKEKHEHTYPFHYKTGSPLMYFPRPGWFIRSTAMRDEMLEANSLINWVPEHIREGRFGKWLENVVDWNITRERYWGSPLPIWSSEDDSESVCVNSISELNEHMVRSGVKPLPLDADLHKPGIDEIVLLSENGQELRREDFVLDSWFNAGIMPWGQTGYPATEGSKEYFESQYPCDFICEGLDQTRGWFYSLLAASTLLAIARGDKDKKRWSSYKTVICTDLVLDEHGEKMSKTKGNVVAPVPMMDKYGADAVRWSFLRNNPWLPVRFGEEALKESLRQIFIPLWNAYSFLVTYANVDHWEPGNTNEMSEPTLIDKWIMACYQDLIEEVTKHLEAYDVMPAASAITDFVDRLTNWYIRRSRRRFWKSDELQDKNRAYKTLHEVLVGLSKIIAPFAPFISEEIYSNLAKNYIENAKDSVHLEDWLEPDTEWQNADLKQRMDYVRKIVSLGHAARNDGKLKVRQPLKTLFIVANGNDRQAVDGLKDLVIDELNIKDIQFVESRSELISWSVKANFKKLGPRFGKDMKSWTDRIMQASQDQIDLWADGKPVILNGESFEPDDVILEENAGENKIVKVESGLTIALDLQLDETLLDEGYARELINKIQNRRKERNLEVTQRISLQIQCDERLTKAFEGYRVLIEREVLAVDLRLEPLSRDEGLIKVNDHNVWFELETDVTIKDRGVK